MGQSCYMYNVPYETWRGRRIADECGAGGWVTGFSPFGRTGRKLPAGPGKPLAKRAAALRAGCLAHSCGLASRH